jgi:hypothetical protein
MLPYKFAIFGKIILNPFKGIHYFEFTKGFLSIKLYNNKQCISFEMYFSSFISGSMMEFIIKLINIYFKIVTYSEHAFRLWYVI